MILQRRLVNWQDSMEITRNCFVQTEDYFIDRIRDMAAVSLTNYNYGLLSQPEGGDNGKGIEINQNMTGQIEIRLNFCDAITSSGIRIHFHPENENGVLTKVYSPATESRADTELWDIVLVIDPYKRIPTGEPDVNEVPPRHPDARPMLEMHVIPSGQLNTKAFGSHHLIIGRIRKDGDTYPVDSHYIPPCRVLGSHRDLVNFYYRMGEWLQKLEDSSLIIIRKVHERTNKSDLAGNLKTICEDVIRYITAIQFSFRNKGTQMMPIEVMDMISQLAHTLYINLNFLKTTQKEELLTYLYEWSNVTPGSFEQMMADVISLRYDHTSIRAILWRTKAFMETLTELWERLCRLEYIGQHKESIVVSERREQLSDQGKSNWNIIG